MIPNEEMVRSMIEEAIKKADSKDAKFIPHEKVVAWLNSWFTPHELDKPEE